MLNVFDIVFNAVSIVFIYTCLNVFEMLSYCFFFLQNTTSEQIFKVYNHNSYRK